MTEEIKEETRINFRLTNEEVELVKKVFRNNRSLLITMEHAFLQIPLNAIELSLLQITFNNKKDLWQIVKKFFLPEFTDDGIYFGGTKDLLMGLETKDLLPEDVALRVKSFEVIEQYLRQQLETFKTGEYQKEQKIKLSDLKNTKDKLDKDIYIDIFARNLIIALVQGQLMNLLQLGNYKEETPEERADRQKKDSSK